MKVKDIEFPFVFHMIFKVYLGNAITNNKIEHWDSSPGSLIDMRGN